MNKILLKIPTRTRKNKFFNIFELYLNNIDYSYKNISFLITLDDDDLEMNSENVMKRFAFLSKLYDNIKIKIVSGKSENKIHAVNRDIDTYTELWDILILASDDMTPVKYGYNKIISEDMEQYFPDLDGVLYYPDAYTPLNTLPIIGNKYYKRFNYIYNPIYKSFFCDNEFMDVAIQLNKHQKIDLILFKHDHPCNVKLPSDELYKNNDKFWDEDKIIFEKRVKEQFKN